MPRLEASDIMSRPVLTVGPESSIVEAARIMAEHRVSGLPVVDAAGALAGIVTEGDLLVREAGLGGLGLLEMYHSPDEDPQERQRRFRGRLVADVMTRDVITAPEHTSVREVAGLLTRAQVNRLPIVRNGNVVGIVTRQDILKVFARPDQELARIVGEHLTRELDVPSTIDVRAKDGIVTVSGQVGRPEDVRLVELCVHTIDGVVGVDVSALAAARSGPAAGDAR